MSARQDAYMMRIADTYERPQTRWHMAEPEESAHLRDLILVASARLEAAGYPGPSLQVQLDAAIYDSEICRRELARLRQATEEANRTEERA